MLLPESPITYVGIICRPSRVKVSRLTEPHSALDALFATTILWIQAVSSGVNLDGCGNGNWLPCVLGPRQDLYLNPFRPVARNAILIGVRFL
jgi:hypothetical protein